MHLFAQEGDKLAAKYLQLATPVCSANGIEVTFEEVTHEKYDVATEGATTEASSTESGEGASKLATEGGGKGEGVKISGTKRKFVAPREVSSSDVVHGGATRSPDVEGGGEEEARSCSKRNLGKHPGREKKKIKGDDAKMLFGRMHTLARSVVDAELLGYSASTTKREQKVYEDRLGKKTFKHLKGLNGCMGGIYQPCIQDCLLARDAELAEQFFGTFKEAADVRYQMRKLGLKCPSGGSSGHMRMTE